MLKISKSGHWGSCKIAHHHYKSSCQSEQENNKKKVNKYKSIASRFATNDAMIHQEGKDVSNIYSALISETSPRTGTTIMSSVPFL